MDSVLVLIAAPGSRRNRPGAAWDCCASIGAAHAALAGGGRGAGGAGISSGLAEFREAIRPPSHRRQSWCPTANRRKRLLIADMDSTMIEQECIDELGVMAGIGDHIKEITARAMRGELDFEGR